MAKGVRSTHPAVRSFSIGPAQDPKDLTFKLDDDRLRFRAAAFDAGKQHPVVLHATRRTRCVALEGTLTVCYTTRTGARTFTQLLGGQHLRRRDEDERERKKNPREASTRDTTHGSKISSNAHEPAPPLGKRWRWQTFVRNVWCSMEDTPNIGPLK